MKNIYSRAGIFLMVLGLAAFLLCTGREARDKELYSGIAQSGKTGVTVSLAQPGGQQAGPPEEAPGGEGNAGGAMEAGEQAVEIPVYDWDGLLALNADTCGWLFLPGSTIDLPVVQASDNDYYLSHSFTGEKNVFGSLFMDRGTAFDDFSRVIYGHSVSSDSEAMFSPLLKFRDHGYFEDNPFFYYTEAYRVMAAMDFNVNDVEEWDFRERNFGSGKELADWMAEVKERSLSFREPDREPEKLLVLSTCCRQVYGKNGRFLVFLYA